VVINSTAVTPGSFDKAEIYTIDGKKLYTTSIAGWRNNVRLLLKNVPEISKGVYVLKVHVNGEIFNSKIIKQ